jgi:flagellar basal body-associated protein FliL
MTNNDILDSYDKVRPSKKKWIAIVSITFILILGILFNFLFSTQKSIRTVPIQQPIPIQID